MEEARALSQWFWNERVWLPPNVTWEELDTLAESNENNYSKFSYLWYPIPAAFLLIFIRTFSEKAVFRPLGIALGLRVGPHRRPPTNDVLESAFQKSKRKLLEEGQAVHLAKKLSMTERQVERWWRMRKALNRPTTLEKFSETG